MRKENAEDLWEEVELAREEVRKAARAVRNCSDSLCDEGFISRDEERGGRTYRFAYEHDCHKAWRRAAREAREIATRYEEAAKREYVDLFSPDMLYLGRPTHEQISKAEFNELYR
ncbi:MAG: hypothetical protein WC251_04265, partial [Candidatus Izemoplasmatales bacterium]